MPETVAEWREPASLLPLRWGSYRGRYLAGLGLAFCGFVVIQLTSTYSLVALPLGLLMHITGWCILPGIGWRRVLGAGVGAITAIVVLNGAPATAFLAAPLGAWLLLRQRRLVSYLVLVIPPIASFPLAVWFPDYGWRAVVLALAGVVLIGAAWLARMVATITGHSPARIR